MKINRRKFLKTVGIAGAGLAGSGMMPKTGNAKTLTPFYGSHKQKFNMHGYRAPKLETVSMGLIGIGSSG